MRVSSCLSACLLAVADDWRNGPLPLLLSMGVVERLPNASPDDEARVRLRPLDTALAAAGQVWRELGEELADGAPRDVGLDCMSELATRRAAGSRRAAAAEAHVATPGYAS